MDLINNIDNNILEFIRLNMNNKFFDIIMPFISSLGNAGFVWIVITIAFLMQRKYRECGIMLLISLVMCLLIGNLTLKPYVARLRPSDINTAIHLLIERPTDFSFPSGHTMSSFAAATVIFNSNKKLGFSAFLLASLIAFSRLYLYVHYPSDVAAAIILGVLISLCTMKIYNRRKEK